MKYAKSMYRAGFIVDAEDCDYNSAKDLGLVCPFCSEALFLRRGHLRGKSSYVEAAFCHYHTDDPIADDCELRAQRPEGQTYIMKVDAESRQQRLEIYNKRLTDLIFDAEQRNTSKRAKRVFKKTFNQHWVEKTPLEYKRLWASNKTDLYQTLVELTQALSMGDFSHYSRAQTFAPSLKQELQETFTKLDSKLHLTICGEVIDFLSTRTAGYAFSNLFFLALHVQCEISSEELYGFREKITLSSELLAKIKANPMGTLGIVLNFVADTNWVKKLTPLL